MQLYITWHGSWHPHMILCYYKYSSGNIFSVWDIYNDRLAKYLRRIVIIIKISNYKKYYNKLNSYVYYQYFNYRIIYNVITL